MAYALGRYSQGISIAKALAQGLGSKVKNALETTIKLSPKHADAHIALGAFHAEVIDKVGSLLGRTQGASKDAGLANYKAALKLNPGSAIAMIEYANGLVMLEGEKRMKEATQLYEEAAATVPLDAMERLDVEMAKAELEGLTPVDGTEQAPTAPGTPASPPDRRSARWPRRCARRGRSRARSRGRRRRARAARPARPAAP